MPHSRTLERPTLGSDPPPRIKRSDCKSDEAYEEATARREAFMKERRKLQQWLHLSKAAIAAVGHARARRRQS